MHNPGPPNKRCSFNPSSFFVRLRVAPRSLYLSVLNTGRTSPAPGDLTSDRKKRNLDGLTGLRFFAAFGVVIYHFTGPALAGWPAPLVNIAGSGFVAVTFFFLLSGFILSYNYLNANGEMRGTKRSFYSSRFARIYPAYLLAFLLAAPTNIPWSLRANHLTVAIAKLFFGGALVLTLQQAWTPWTAWYWNFPAWSVSVEAFFYLVFPFVAWRIYRIRPSFCLLAACGLWIVSLCAPLALYLVKASTGGPATHLQMAVEFTPILRLPEFLIGISLGRMFSSGSTLSLGLSKAIFCLSAVAILAVLAQVITIPDPLLTALLIPLFAILIYAVAEGAFKRALSLPLLVLLGEASYGIYILQIPVAYLLHVPPPHASLGVFAMYSASLLAISVFSLRFIELPLRSRIRRFLDPAAGKDRSSSRFPGIDIITCEYPPSLGGVADYTFKVASELERRGCATRVWVPGNERTSEITSTGNVMRSFGRFGPRDIFVNERFMGTAEGRWLLLQWEPVGFGLQSFNLPFCLWIATRALRGTRLVIMFHETFLPFNKRSLKRYLAGAVQRLMAFILLNGANAVFASNESGARSLKRLCFRPAKVLHLPVFSNVEGRRENLEQVAAMRKEVARTDEVLIGHFGRFMANTEPLVLPPLKTLLQRDAEVKVLFIGECGERYRSALLAKNPELSGRVFDSGVRTSEEIAGLISACDLMFQPYPGGITTKRGSIMASLAHGRCVVSNKGTDTERLWSDCAALRLVETSDPGEIAAELSRLTAARAELAQRSAAASAFYQSHFSLEHTVDAVLLSIRHSEAARASARV
jgi:peptidoglycan/LPS O-acetylase OafA/YrhL/glycosyltransferase involved in cell wall biosynthesis